MVPMSYGHSSAHSLESGEISGPCGHITQENLAVDAQVDRTVISDLERKTQRLYRPIGSVSGRIVCRISEFFSEPLTNEEPKPTKAGRKPTKN